MNVRSWEVSVIGQARKAKKTLPRNSLETFAVLLKELIELGPYRANWPNYSKLKGSKEDYHCHIEQGKPTYVACWSIVNKKERVMEVYYVGTHENAPY